MIRRLIGAALWAVLRGSTSSVLAVAVVAAR
jgi:hypothetical protein